MPAWADGGGRAYWEAADVHERKNGNLFRELEFALPHELPEAERHRLAHEFMASICDAQGLPYTLAVHEKPGNSHAHGMISERMNDGYARSPEAWFKRAANQGKEPGTGGARKADLGQSREWLATTRATWAAMCNHALELHGVAARIDHRTLEAQGITDRLPQIHLGPNVVAMEKKGIETNRGDSWLEVQSANGELQTLREVKQQIKDLLEPKMVQAKKEKRVLSDAQKQEVAVIVNCYSVESGVDILYAEEQGCGYLQDQYGHDEELMLLMQKELILHLQTAREQLLLQNAEERKDLEQELNTENKLRMK